MLTTTLEQEGIVDSSPVLTGDQQRVLDQLLSWCTNPSDAHPAAVLKGYAGTGKTFTLSLLVRKLIDKGLEVGVTAPTHKAVKVLRGDPVERADYRTVHSMLALKEKYDMHTGRVYYDADMASKYKPPVADIDVMILDECSMLDNDLFNKLVPWIKGGLKVVFSGDPIQIPPVNHPDCIPFLKAKEWNMLELGLTDIIRQKEGNPILEFAGTIRQKYKTGYYQPRTSLVSKGEGVSVANRNEEQELFRTHFCSEGFKLDTDYMKVIAWRNATVDRYNGLVRDILHGKGAARFVVGEKLIMASSYAPSGTVLVNNNEDMEVLEITTKETSWEHPKGKLKGKLTLLKTRFKVMAGWKEITLPVVHEDSEKQFNALLESLRSWALRTYGSEKAKMWKIYFSLKAQVACVSYGYAITGHKSQGSTYDNCMVLKWDLDVNHNIEERNRILYTACTRPRHLLMIEP